jgi:UDP-N-acetylglucosamine 4,6-dehydratase
MTRFWITLDQAVKFVLASLEEQEGGEIFVPKSPSVCIKDLARAIFPTQSLREIGVRPGEKLHEILISQDDAGHTYEFDTHYRIVPAFPFQRPSSLSMLSARQVPSDFSLASHTNPLLLSSLDAIKGLIADSDKS